MHEWKMMLVVSTATAVFVGSLFLTLLLMKAQ